MQTITVKCCTCGEQYVVAVGYSMKAPHKNGCTAPKGWQVVRPTPSS